MNEKASAAYTLSDEISDMRLQLSRADVALQEIIDTYFGYDPTTERGKFALEYEFDRYSTFADMVCDYLFKVRRVINDLSELADEGRKNGNELRLIDGGDAS